MAKHYVTFGFGHVHEVNGKKLDHNTVAVFNAENATEGRQKAFELFNIYFAFEYHDNVLRLGVCYFALQTF